MNIISKKDAREQGLKRYFTGKPCKKNRHISERLTSNSGCCECHYLGNKIFKEKRPDCDKTYYINNRVKLIERTKKYYLSNKDSAAIYQKLYYNNNIDKINKINRAWTLRNLDKVNTYSAKKRASRLQRVVPWADTNKIKQIYSECARISKDTGISHQVDHIIPLKGKLVSGLHVEYNLQIITKIENSSKSNKFNPETYNA